MNNTERRTLEITLEHAEDLSSAKLIGKMAIYAVVALADEHNDAMSLERKSPVDHGGDTAPTWNFAMNFKVDEAALRADCLALRFRLVCRGYFGDRDVGDAEVSVKHLFDLPAEGGADGWRCASEPVRKPDGIPQGRLSFSYKFGEKTGTPAAAPPPTPEKSWGRSLVDAGVKIVAPLVIRAVLGV